MVLHAIRQPKLSCLASSFVSLSQHFGQVLCPTCCQKLGHVSPGLFAEFEQLMQSVLIVHKVLNVLKQKAKFVRV